MSHLGGGQRWDCNKVARVCQNFITLIRINLVTHQLLATLEYKQHKKMNNFLQKTLWGLVFVFMLSLANFAQSQVIKVKQAELEKVDSAWLLNANFGIELSSGLENALKKGVTLHFLVQFELTRSRWYWFDEKAFSKQRLVRLSYQPLINQYRINAGGLAFNTNSLEEALRIAGAIGAWDVIELARIDPEKKITKLPYG